MPEKWGGKRPNAGRKATTGRTDRITISIRPDLLEQIKAIGSASEVIEKALERYLLGK